MNVAVEMPLSINSSFLRSARVDQDDATDIASSYVVSASVSELIRNLCDHQVGTGQGAFTWTGPYGSGKSTLALVLAGLLKGAEPQRKSIADAIGFDGAEDLWKALPPVETGWKIVNVVGANASPSDLLKKALRDQGLLKGKRISDERQLAEALLELSQADTSSGGVMIFFDELGKCLESIAAGEGDAYFFQLLAEAASRSGGRLVFVGILHQAFQEYASKLAREVRDEWSKIQGRFVDLSVNLSSGEQIELIANAVDAKESPGKFRQLSENLDRILAENSPSQFGFEQSAAFCRAWPLHPLVTSLLGPISRRSYGQNQRSIFSFLASAERFGLQDFLSSQAGSKPRTYELADLWDYLETNLHSSIAVSLDGHHFASAQDAVSRAILLEDAELGIRIIKAISLLEFTSRTTGLSARKPIILNSVDASQKAIEDALDRLENAKIITFQKFRDAYVLFDGSDFDIEAELETALRSIGEASLKTVSDALAVSTVVAKRHYLETGSLRWCQLLVNYESQAENTLNSFQPNSSCFGALVFCLEDGGSFDPEKVEAEFDFAVCRSAASKNLVAYARELEALKLIASTNQELQRDKVARREVADRMDAVSFYIEKEIWSILKSATWQFADHSAELSWAQLSALVSDLADKRFSQSPRLRNELLNRDKPSGNANAALKLLAYRLLSYVDEEHLGIEKYPAEKGLYLSIVHGSGLHVPKGSGWGLTRPSEQDPNNLNALWAASRDFLLSQKDNNVPLTDLYDLWSAPPFGVKRGLMSLLALLFMLTEKAKLSFYRDGLFLTQLTDVDVDYILRSPQAIQLRWMDMTAESKLLLTELANVAGKFSSEPVAELSSLEVARSLIFTFDSAPKWVHRTSQLSKHAREVRALFKRSNDPNQFMFTDLPELVGSGRKPGSANQVALGIRSGLQEILDAYPTMLRAVGEHLLTELHVPGRSKEALKELRERAQNVNGIAGDLRLNAFVGRLVEFDGSDRAIERVISFAVNKPPQNWIDNDIDKARVEISLQAYEFLKLETVARVAGRKDKRHALAFVHGGAEGRQLVSEFEVPERDMATVERIERDLESMLAEIEGNVDANVVLAALARVSAKRIGG